MHPPDQGPEATIPESAQLAAPPAELSVPINLQHPYPITAETVSRRGVWFFARKARRISYRYRSLNLVVGPVSYGRIGGWLLGWAILFAPIAWAALLEISQIQTRPELLIATTGWFMIVVTHQLYRQFTAGSEFSRWATRHGDLVNEFGGSIELFSRVLRQGETAGTALKPESLRSVLRRLVRQSRDSAAGWVSCPAGARFRAFLVVSEAKGKHVQILEYSCRESSNQLPFGRVPRGTHNLALAYGPIHPRIVQDTHDERYGSAFSTWNGYRSIVSFPLAIGTPEDSEWLGCLNIECSEPYVFPAAHVQRLLTNVLRPQTELLAMVLLYAKQHAGPLR